MSIFCSTILPSFSVDPSASVTLVYQDPHPNMTPIFFAELVDEDRGGARIAQRAR